MLSNLPHYQNSSTRSTLEVQNSDARIFTTRLTSVFSECNRILKDDGLFVFTYHHSRLEGWQSILSAIHNSGFRIRACHPVKSEMSVAASKSQAKQPINFDIVIVCRKVYSHLPHDKVDLDTLINEALDNAIRQIRRLSDSDWKLSLNDIKIIVMAQIISSIPRPTELTESDDIFGKLSELIPQEIQRIHQLIS